MGYVLINGQRFYQDDRGNVTLDNVSQEEADRRERRNAASLVNHTYAPRPAGESTCLAAAERKIPWKIIILLGVILLTVGALIYNYKQKSPSERIIEDYMKYEAEVVPTVSETEKIIQTEQGQETVNIPEVTAVPEEITETPDAQSDYLLPESVERYLYADEICYYSPDEIQLLINEIYARHGREFSKQKNIDYFSKQDWYHPVSGKTDDEIIHEFNVYEKANVELLSEYL